MALNDPLAITLDGAKTLAKIIDDGLKSVYTSADGKITCTVSHQVTDKKRRTLVRIDETKVSPDPYTAALKPLVGTAYVVFEHPIWGFDSAAKIAEFTALTGMLTAASNAVLTRILNGEH